VGCFMAGQKGRKAAHSAGFLGGKERNCSYHFIRNRATIDMHARIQLCVYDQLRTIVRVRLKCVHSPSSLRKRDQAIAMMRPNVTHDARGSGALENFKNDRVFVGAGERHNLLPNGVPESRESFLSQDLLSSVKFFLYSHLNLLVYNSQESRRLRSHIHNGCTSLRIVYFRVNKESFFPPSR